MQPHPERLLPAPLAADARSCRCDCPPDTPPSTPTWRCARCGTPSFASSGTAPRSAPTRPTSPGAATTSTSPASSSTAATSPARSSPAARPPSPPRCSPAPRSPSPARCSPAPRSISATECSPEARSTSITRSSTEDVTGSSAMDHEYRQDNLRPKSRTTSTSRSVEAWSEARRAPARPGNWPGTLKPGPTRSSTTLPQQSSRPSPATSPWLWPSEAGADAGPPTAWASTGRPSPTSSTAAAGPTSPPSPEAGLNTPLWPPLACR